MKTQKPSEKSRHLLISEYFKKVDELMADGPRMARAIESRQAQEQATHERLMKGAKPR